MNSVSPWISRLELVNSIDAIKKHSRRPAQPLYDLHDATEDMACDRISRELNEIFVPTTSACELMRDFIQCGLSHAKTYYPTTKTFIQRCYGPEICFEPTMPIILSGPAGTGKSQLAKALVRMLGQETLIYPDPDHTAFPHVPVRRIAVHSQKSIYGILSLLSSPDYARTKTLKLSNDMVKHCVRWQYQSGVSLIIPDELQFLSQSTSANAFLASVILQLTYIGIPLVIIGNYSLLHRLLLRPQEERQRILGRPAIMLPDPPDSADWVEILEEYQRAVPEVYAFSFKEKKYELWNYCAGLKRELVKLLVLAYRQCRRQKLQSVTWADIEVAYRSFEFAAQRGDIEESIAHAIEGKKKRKDLWCPLLLPVEMTQSYTQALKECRNKKVREAAQFNSLTVAERATKNAIESTLTSAPRKSKASVTSINRKSDRSKQGLTDAAKRLNQRWNK